MSKKQKRKTETFLPTEENYRMLQRALANDRGIIPFGAKTYYINEALREKLIREGHARKRELKAAA